MDGSLFCQDIVIQVGTNELKWCPNYDGHNSLWCPENVCTKCGRKGHSDLQCLFQKICYICQEFETNVGHETISCSKANTCFICQDFKVKIGHETSECSKIICKKCGQGNHTKIKCMILDGWLLLPNEILSKIVSNLNGRDLYNCAKVSRRLETICQIQLDELYPNLYFWLSSTSKHHKDFQKNFNAKIKRFKAIKNLI